MAKATKKKAAPVKAAKKKAAPVKVKKAPAKTKKATAKAKKKTTASVLQHHVQALVSRQLNEVLRDYCAESVLCTADGTAKGLEGIRAAFAGLLKTFPPEVSANMKNIKLDINGEYAYVIWTMPPAVKLGSDTFHVRDGKIMMQSVVIQPA
jgi:ketosteroid isomerase-like protein